MSTWALVRHGQANFFTVDYDRLAELGKRQGGGCGGCGVGEVGGLGVGWGGRGGGVGEEWVEWVGGRGVEVDAGAVVQGAVLQSLCERDESFVRLKSDYENAAEGEEQYRTFHRLLAGVMQVWISGDLDTNGLMPWTEFRDGVLSAIDTIRGREGSGRRGAVFSSGGAIGVTGQAGWEGRGRRGVWSRGGVSWSNVTPLVTSSFVPVSLFM